MNPSKTMNAATLNREDFLPLEKVSQSSLPTTRPSEVAKEDAKEEPVPETPKKSNGTRNLILGGILLVACVATAFYYVKYVAPYESTDDAFIEAHVTPVAPQVSGRVEKLFVEDNQMVTKGDLLLQIDPRDYQAKLDEDKAALVASQSRIAQANAQFAVDQAKVDQEKANVIAAESEAARAGTDYKRYQAVGNFAVSESQLDMAATQARSSTAQVEAARSKELAAEAQAALDKVNIQTAAAEVEKSEAMVRQSELNLSYTQVRAQDSGFITHRTVENGAYVQTGQSLLAIVPRQVWVVANFKETQLNRMRPGQPVEVKMDAYPNITFKGHVDSIQSGTGPRFSLLPPENATGNYVKVVQRVPVKIIIDGDSNTNYVFGPGMSVVPEVRVD